MDPPMAARRFEVGELVEVASVEEGFVGSYYEGSVVARLPKKGYIVQYVNLVTDDLSAPLKESASEAEVRPRPPVIKEREYRPHDEVDVFDNEGWWVGRITGRAPRDKYTVYFPTTGEKGAYNKDRLRLHQDWINEKWVHGSTSGCHH